MDKTATGLRARLLALLEPLLEQLGYELVDLELRPSQQGGALRVFIDLPGAGSGPATPQIGIEDCERASREVSALLDREDPIPGRYALEVSSPGFDRVLRKPEHYERFAGSRVKVELALPREGRRRYTGVLQRVDGLGIELQVDGQKVLLPFAEIGKTRLAL
jgi:ribosome maturation factor RimP